MNYRGDHRKYEPGTSVYRVYKYGDVVSKDGKYWVCGISLSYGYMPYESQSGFTAMSFSTDPSPNPNQIDGGNI